MAHHFFHRAGFRNSFNHLAINWAKVAELVDALDLGSSGATRGSSSLPFRTTGNTYMDRFRAQLCKFL